MSLEVRICLKKIERAEIVVRKYCGVLAMYKSAVPVSYEIKINSIIFAFQQKMTTSVIFAIYLFY